jgi:hypothetical protein
VSELARNFDEFRAQPLIRPAGFLLVRVADRVRSVAIGACAVRPVLFEEIVVVIVGTFGTVGFFRVFVECRPVERCGVFVGIFQLI